MRLTPEGISLEKDVAPGESITHVTGRRLDFLVISTVVRRGHSVRV